MFPSSAYRTLVALALVAVLAASSAGCAYTTTIQSADVLPEGEHRIGMGVSQPVKLEPSEIAFAVPQLVLWGRYSPAERVELQAWLSNVGGGIGSKYQLVGGRHTRGFSLSAGAELMGGGLGRMIMGPRAQLQGLLHTGYRFSDSFAVFLTPKYAALAHSVSQLPDVEYGTEGTTLSTTTTVDVGMVIGRDFEFIWGVSARYVPLFDSYGISNTFGMTF